MMRLKTKVFYCIGSNTKVYAAALLRMRERDLGKWASPEAIAGTIHFILSGSGRQMRESVLTLYNEF